MIGAFSASWLNLPQLTPPLLTLSLSHSPLATQNYNFASLSAFCGIFLEALPSQPMAVRSHYHPHRQVKLTLYGSVTDLAS
jgi:hypothetical protein